MATYTVDAAALQINYARLWASQFADVFTRAHGDNAIAKHRDGFGFGLFVIYRPDFAVEQEQVGGELGAGGVV